MITPLQRENLAKLADFLQANAEALNFDMEEFSCNSLNPVQVAQHPCGSIGCAIGHGPAAGIEPLPTEKSWNDYATRVFGIGLYAEGWVDDSRPIWRGLFSPIWSHYDNSASGAAERIHDFLDTGRLWSPAGDLITP